MKGLVPVLLLAILVAGCGPYQEPWREQPLSSGKSVKVKSLLIGWGGEHDEPRAPNQDCFILQFVYSDPAAIDEVHEREAKEVFELIRPISEQWGFKQAELMAYRSTKPERRYDLFVCERGTDGRWTSKMSPHWPPSP